MEPTPSEEAARTLAARGRARHEAREAERLEVLARVTRALVAELPPGARAWIIGSLAWGGFFPASDIDLVVDGLSAHQLIRLERAAVDVGRREVDLLALADLPPSFRDRVIAEGIALHAR